MDVAIDDPSLLQNLATELNYRLALTLNTLVQTTADTANTTDSTVNITLANGSYLTAANIRTATQQLAGVNARPLSADGYYGGIIHPYIVHDLMNDSSFGGITDILKRNDYQRLLAPVSNDDAVTFAGVRFKQTSTATTTTTISGNTAYPTYIFADDAIFSVFLGKNPTGGDKSYRLNIQEAPAMGSVSDPARQIGGWVSYNVRYTNTLRPGSTMTIN